MASHKLARLLAVAGIAALGPLTATSSANASTPAGNYVLHNLTTRSCADVTGTGAVGGRTPVWQDECHTSQSGDNQVFAMENTRSSGGHQLFVFVNLKDQLCMDLPGAGAPANSTPVWLDTCASNSANDNQEWYREEVIPNAWLIVNAKNPNLCLDVSGTSHDGTDLKDRQPLTVYTCSGPADDVNWEGYVAGYDDHLWEFDSPSA